MDDINQKENHVKYSMQSMERRISNLEDLGWFIYTFHIRLFTQRLESDKILWPPHYQSRKIDFTPVSVVLTNRIRVLYTITNMITITCACSRVQQGRHLLSFTSSELILIIEETALLKGSQQSIADSWYECDPCLELDDAEYDHSM